MYIWTPKQLFNSQLVENKVVKILSEYLQKQTSHNLVSVTFVTPSVGS